MSLTLEQVAGWAKQNLWAKSDRIVARAGIIYGTGSDAMSNYVQGTWTPVLTGSTGNPTVTYTASRVGQYTRIGNVVYYNAWLQVDSISGGSGNAGFSLPIAVPDSALSRVPGSLYIAVLNVGATIVHPVFLPEQNTSYGYIHQSVDDDFAAVTQISALRAGTLVIYSGFYFVV